MKYVCSLVCMLLAGVVFAASIEGQTKVEAYKLVRLQASVSNQKAAVLWRVFPPVDRATSPRGVLEFVAPPGEYRVELLAISNAKDEISIEEAFTTVTISPPAGAQPAPPKPDAPKPDAPSSGRLDPPAALGRIQFGNAGCTATIVGPRRADGRWDVLTAAHCMPGKGNKGRLTLKDGRTFGITVVEHQPGPDVAWAVTDEAVADMPYANLAKTNARAGVAVWHAGYGVDRPGNRETGEITRADTGSGQAEMILNVSSGDSGGGILREDTNEIVAVVCCTRGRGVKTQMFGCNAETAARFRPTRAVEDTGTIEHPSAVIPDEPIPMEIPLRE